MSTRHEQLRSGWGGTTDNTVISTASVQAAIRAGTKTLERTVLITYSIP